MTPFFLIYNFLFIPLFFILVHIAVFFNPKIRKGILGRIGLFKRLEQNLSEFENVQQRIWIHVASMGEFEQGMPVIEQVLGRFKNAIVILSVFSPSAYTNIKFQHPRLVITYMPIDGWFHIRRFLKIVKPAVAITVRHDIWPNVQWQIRKRKMPSFLIDASITDKNEKTYYRFRVPFRTVLEGFNKILTVSDKSSERFEMLYSDKSNIENFGDTRYDRVLQRSRQLDKIQWLIDEKYFVHEKTCIIGSTWPTDDKLWIPATVSVLKSDPEFRFVLAPHETTAEHIALIEGLLKTHDIPFVRLSQLEQAPEQRDFRFLIIDRIGLLANLYALGLLAYVGGGFSPGVHNVLEPAAHGCAVCFGPRNIISVEPRFLIDAKGAKEIKGESDLLNVLDDFINHPDKLRETGTRALNFIKQNTGASEKISKLLDNYL